MGNTNLPQAGAANLENGRDTLSGVNQLTDAQQREVRQSEAQRHDDGHDANSEGIGPSPSRPKNAPPRVPGQDIDAPREDRDDQQSNEATKQALDEAREGLAPDDPYNPLNTTGAGDPPLPRSHVPSGHSPSDAT